MKKRTIKLNPIKVKKSLIGPDQNAVKINNITDIARQGIPTAMKNPPCTKIDSFDGSTSLVR